MAEHSHIVRDDLRGPLQPVDQLSHISRINDWQGSDSWVEGCRKDRPMPDLAQYPEPKLPYQLLTPSYHDGVRRRAGEVVYIEPSKRGTQHSMIDGVDYPHAENIPASDKPTPRMTDNDRMSLLYMQGLERRIAALESWRRDFLDAPSPLDPPSAPEADAKGSDKGKS
jgi:hypothetical protein